MDTSGSVGISIEAAPASSALASAGTTRQRAERQWRLDHSKFAAAKQEDVGDEDEKKNIRSRLGVGHGVKSAVRGYYQRQHELIEGFSEMDALDEQLLLPTDADEKAAEKMKRSEWLAINASNYTNMLLLAAKVVCAVQSRSLAIIATALDSLLDLLSGFILWYTASSMRKANPYKYPIGKARMQPLGIIVFASVMACLGLQIIIEAARQFFSSDHQSGFPSSWPYLVVIMVSVTIIKLILYLYCSALSNEIVQAYAADHFFDVVTNSLGLAAAVLAMAFAWWIDPVGAIVLALYTIVNWGKTVRENVESLSGQSAPPDFLQKLTYLCWNHHEAIHLIDTVRAYTFGSHYFTEVDVVLPPGMALREAHDIGESLQNKLECLPEVERAFVHLDYEVSHRPEHHGNSRFVVPPPASLVVADIDELSGLTELQCQEAATSSAATG